MDRKWPFQSSSLNFRHLVSLLLSILNQHKSELFYFVTITSDRNDSVKILNHWTSFLPDISASILKSNYDKLLASGIFELTA